MTNRYPVKMLEEVCEVFDDGDWVESKDQAEAGIRLIQTGNIGIGTFKARDGKARYVSNDTFNRLRCREIFEGDCLISRLPDPVGRACLVPNTGERMITAVDCTIVRFRPGQVLAKFFGFYSQSADYLEAVDSETTGATRSRISRSSLGRIPVPVPSLLEQERIIGVLDEAFAAMATARANAERNLRNASEVFENHLQSVFSQHSTGWTEKALGELGTITSSKRIFTADIRKKGKVPKNGSTFFTIFQTFMSGDGETPYFGDYPADFFDFIVVDECHRGGANDEGTWRAILDYFAPAVQLGMTATPKRRDNIDTYKYFGDPVYIYSLKEGINDGFLTPFKVKQISTTMDEYVYTSDDIVLEGAVDAGRLYEERDFNRIIEIKAREAYRVSLLMGMIDQREKTIVFCVTQLHALAVRDLINQMKTSRDPNYCARVTANDGARGDQYLREFQDNEKTIPTVLTTSQKLSTGVDARNIRNIVLMRPIGSMIEFKQIIGRGTRIYDGKDYFTIYDFVKAHHFFSDPEWDGEPEEVTVAKPGVVAGPAPEPADLAARDAPEPPPAKIVVKLADGKARTIQSMVQTTFWDPSGTPMTAAEFLVSLFGTLPDFFRTEDDLRAFWSVPDTRKALLVGLADKGFGAEALSEMQRVIDAENSDIFDVLAYVAFALDPLTRVKRAADARGQVHRLYTDRQQAFIDFVLDHYTKEGVGELDGDKLAPLLKLRYKNAISDALADLGNAEQIRGLFIGFQRYLYESREGPAAG